MCDKGFFDPVKLDAHCHLQHDPAFARYAASNPDKRFFCMTETPKEYKSFRALFCQGAFPSNVSLGVGLHPWSVSSDARVAADQAREVCALIEETGVGANAPAALDDSAASAMSGDHGVCVTPASRAVASACAVPAASGDSGAWLIGEVGLDFSAKHVLTRENQLAAFHEIAAAAARASTICATQAREGVNSEIGDACKAINGCPACAYYGSSVSHSEFDFAQAGIKVLSIHAVQAAQEALDILRETGCLETCICIFHWFSGTGEQLLEARRAGCFFSFGPRALATKRGRAYAAQIPKNQLLYESDAYGVSEEWVEKRAFVNVPERMLRLQHKER